DRLLRSSLVLPPPPAQRGGGIPAGARGTMKRLVVTSALAAALALPGAAGANGDPASDVLPVATVFLPSEAPISKSASNALPKTVAEANQKGCNMRIAGV